MCSHRAEKIRRYKFYDLSFGGFDYITANTEEHVVQIRHAHVYILLVVPLLLGNIFHSN